MASYAYLRKEYPISLMDQLEKIINYKCDDIFIEETEITKTYELERLLSSLQSENQLLVYDIRVLAKGPKGLRKLFEQLQSNDIHLISLQDNLDTKETLKFYDNVLLGLSIEETYRKCLIQQRLDEVKLDGQVLGRPSVDTKIISKIVFLFEKKGKSMREIAEICQVSLGTVHKYIKKNVKMKN